MKTAPGTNGQRSAEPDLDPDLPTLEAALDPGKAWPHLRAILDAGAAGPGGGPVVAGDWELRGVRLVRHKPGRRALIEYDIARGRSPDAPRSRWLGKLRGKGLDRKTPALLRALRERGFGDVAADGIHVPAVLGEIPALNLWLQEGVDAEALGTWPRGAAGERLGRRLAEALHKVHRAGVPARRRHGVAEELHILDERYARLANERPAWRGRLARVLEGCRAVAESLRGRPTTGIHRDFHPGQVLMSREEMWLIDFDLYAEGDRALDLGNFLGHLTEWALRDPVERAGLGTVAAALRRRHVELIASGEGASAGSEAAAVESWEILTLARHVSLSTQYPEREAFTESVLRCCEERLARRHGGRAPGPSPDDAADHPSGIR